MYATTIALLSHSERKKEKGRNQSLLSSSEEGEGQINKRRGEMLMILGRWRKDGPVIKGLFIGKQVTNNGVNRFLDWLSAHGIVVCNDGITP